MDILIQFCSRIFPVPVSDDAKTKAYQMGLMKAAVNVIHIGNEKERAVCASALAPRAVASLQKAGN